MVFAVLIALALPGGPVAPPTLSQAARPTVARTADTLAIQLHPRLGVAYDPATGALLSVWGGKKVLESASRQPVWTLRQGDQEAASKIEFKGYRFVDGHVRLQYRIPLSGKEVWIYETPSVTERLDNHLELFRKFTVRGLGRNESVGLLLATPESRSRIEGGQLTGSTLWLSPDRTHVASTYKVPPLGPETMPAARILPHDAFTSVPAPEPRDPHPAFDAAKIELPGIDAGVRGMDFMPDGRLAVVTGDGRVSLVAGLEGPDPVRLQTRVIATGLADPVGLRVVDGRITVMQRHELTLLKDHDGDDVTDEYFAVAGGFSEAPVGLAAWKGRFLVPFRSGQEGTLVAIQPTGEHAVLATLPGLPRGIGIGPSDRLLLTLGGAGNARLVVFDGGRLSTVAWLPSGKSEVAPVEPTILDVGPYQGQVIVGESFSGGTMRVAIDEADGTVQGTTLRMGGSDASAGGLLWGPKKTLYTWGDGNTKIGRLRYNFQVPFEVLATRALANGLEIEFTEPLQPGTGRSPGDYRITKTSESTAVAGEPIWARSVTISPDRRKVFLEITDLTPRFRYDLRLNPGLTSNTGRMLAGTDASVTVQHLPDMLGKVAPQMEKPNTLTDAEKKEGFQLLFDGKSMDAWKGFKRDGIPGVWSVHEGEIRVSPGNEHGDIVTKEVFEDFDLRLEWKASPGANSGIFYRVAEEGDAVWWTGPEMQVLDDERHNDGKNPITSAGSQYGMYARRVASVRPAGFWNEVRIVAQGKKVTYWLNGAIVNEVEIDSADWKKRVLESKFARPGYGKQKSGKIALQDHGDLVTFRNLRIKRL